MNRYRLFKQLWKNRYPVGVWGKDVVPPVLKEKGIEIVDPTEEKVEEPLQWTPPVEGDTRFARFYPQEDPRTDVNWHDEPAMSYEYPGQLLTGLKQAQFLTNTAVYQKLPTSLEESMAEITPSQENLAQRAALSAHKWFPGEDRLLKHYWPEFPKFKLRTEKGSHHKDIVYAMNHFHFA